MGSFHAFSRTLICGLPRDAHSGRNSERAIESSKPPPAPARMIGSSWLRDALHVSQNGFRFERTPICHAVSIAASSGE